MTQEAHETAGGAEPQPAAAPKTKRRRSVGPRSIRGRIFAGVVLVIPVAVTVLLIRSVFNAALAVGVRLINLFSQAALWMLDIAMDLPASSGRAGSGGGSWRATLVSALSEAAENPPEIDPTKATWYQNLLAVLLTLLVLYLLGWLGTNVAGRRLIGFVEGLVRRIPMVATVYSAIKRMAEVLFGEDKPEEAGKQVVLVDFPHERTQAIGFLTNTITDRSTRRHLATVFLPTTPNPTSGYLLIVPVDRLTGTDWTMEEALSMVLSAGASARPDVTLRPPDKASAGAAADGADIHGRRGSR